MELMGGSRIQDTPPVMHIISGGNKGQYGGIL